MTPAELVSGSRCRVVAHDRAVASFIAVRELGLPMTVVAAQSRSRLRSYGRESPEEPPSWGTEVSA